MLFLNQISTPPTYSSERPSNLQTGIKGHMPSHALDNERTEFVTCCLYNGNAMQIKQVAPVASSR